jgi:hypothetical protein
MFAILTQASLRSRPREGLPDTRIFAYRSTLRYKEQCAHVAKEGIRNKIQTVCQWLYKHEI